MNAHVENASSNAFLIGMITGGVIGAGLAFLFAPRSGTELRRRVQTSVVGVVDGVTAKGQAIRDDVADAVGRGAREVEQFAMASKTR